MGAVVLTVIAAWLVLSALATVACTLLARAGQLEDLRRLEAETDPALLGGAGLSDDAPYRITVVG